MKKKIFSFALMCSLMLLVSSCFDDDSTAWENPVTRITIDGIESAYEKTAYVNDRLQIHPVVETGPSDDKIQYKWILINEKTGTTTAQGDTIQPIEIGTTKDLDYEVNVAPGKYQIRLSDRYNYWKCSFGICHAHRTDELLKRFLYPERNS